MSTDLPTKVVEAKQGFLELLNTLVPGTEESKKEIKCERHPYPVHLYQFKNPSKTMSTPVYRVESRLEFPPWAVATLYAHWNGTTSFRKNLHYFHAVNDIDATSDVLYSLTRKVAVISPRDYVDVRGFNLEEADNTMLIYGCSLELDHIPKRKSVVRGVFGPYGFHITPHPENPQHTAFTLIHNLDFRGSIPGFVLKSLINNIMVMVFDSLHDTLVKVTTENWAEHKAYRDAYGTLPAEAELAALDEAAQPVTATPLVVTDPEAPLPMPPLTEQQKAVRIRKFDLVEFAIAAMKGEKGSWADAKAEFERMAASLTSVMKPSC